MSATPGPWRVGTKVGRTIYRSAEGGPEALIGVMDGVEDAVLAAAAPELCEALRDLLGAHDCGHGEPLSHSNCSRCRARYVLAKATTPWRSAR